MPNRNNNFDALRLFLATLVLFSHSFALNGGPDPISHLTRGQLDGGSSAVDGFFVISGFLITQSWLVSGTTDAFLRKRIRRIYPGYLAALAVSFLAAAALAAQPIAYLKLSAFRGDAFLLAIGFLGYGALDNRAAFPNNPYPGAVNGSLWTLQPELFCYLAVAGLGVLGLLARRRVVLLATALLYAVYIVQVTTRLGSGGSNLTRVTLHFAVGSLYWLYQPRLGRPFIALASIAILAVGTLVPPALAIAVPIAGSYLLLSFAFSQRIRLYDAASKGDLSYGVYLYAFVVQQSVLAIFPPARQPIILFLVAAPITFASAWLSWHFVEKRFVRRRQEGVVSSGERNAVLVPG